MMVLEDVARLPQSNKFGSGGPWVFMLPIPAPWRWRLRDAWEVLCGRAEAVREATIEDIARWDVSDGPVAPSDMSGLLRLKP
jgi:hypothetical protein